MRAGLGALGIVLGGCELVFPLSPEACPVTAAPSCGVSDPDEDGDALRDDCDPCPQIQGAATVDTDQDAIGDQCDPRPTTKARCLSRRFFGFQRAAGWQDTTGWSFDGNAFSEDPDRASDTLIMLLSIDQLPTGQVELVIRDGTINGDPAGSITGLAAMMVDGTGYFCGFRQSTRTTLLARLRPGGEEVLRIGEKGLGVTPGVTHQMVFRADRDGQLSCRASIYDLDSYTVTEVVEELTFDDPTPSTSGSIGVVLRSSTASFEYLDFVAD